MSAHPITPNDDHTQALRRLLGHIRGRLRDLSTTSSSEELIAGLQEFENLMLHLRVLTREAARVNIGRSSIGTNIGDGTMITRDIAGHNIYNLHVDMHPALPAAVQRITDSIDNAEKLYLQRIINVANPAPLGGMALFPGSGQPPLMENIYIPLLTHRRDGAGRLVSAMQAIIWAKRLVVLGEPGAGKTSLLKRIAYNLAAAILYDDEDYLENLAVQSGPEQRAATWCWGRLVPIYLQLGDITLDGATEGSASLITAAIRQDLVRHDLGDYWGLARSAMAKGRAIFLFDGLDEALEPVHRQIIRDAVEDLAATYSSNRFVITCRTLSYADPFRLRSFSDTTLAPLTPGAVEQFISHWYTEMARLKNLPEAEAFRQAALLQQAVRDLPDLAANPLLLTVMAAVHTEQGDLPKERARLLQMCIRMLLWEWQRGKPSTHEEASEQDEELLSALAEIAYQMHGREFSGTGTAWEISQGEIIETLKTHLGLGWGEAEHVFEYLERRAGVLVNRGYPNRTRPIYAFPHRSLREHLAAVHLAKQPNFNRHVVSLVKNNPAWREIILLAAGHLAANEQQSTRVLDAADFLSRVTPTTHAGWHRIWIAGELLTIVGRSAAQADEHLGPHLLEHVRDMLVHLVTMGHLDAARRVRAARVLAELDDPRPGAACLPPDAVPIEGGALEMDTSKTRVNIEPFSVTRYPITWGQFMVFVESPAYTDPAFWSKAGREWLAGAQPRQQPDLPNMPAVGVSWFEAEAFARWLSEREGRQYTLLSEAEWQWAACGASPTKYPFGERAADTDLNLRESGIGAVAPVGVFVADVTRDGVCGMGGNIREWCADELEGRRVVKGGAYNIAKRDVHMRERLLLSPKTTAPYIGFRLKLL